MLTLMLAALVGQAPAQGVWIVATKRQGVSANSAGEFIAAVDAHLAPFPRVGPVGDLASCKGKLPCLLAAGRKQRAAFLVTVEAARILDKMIVKVSLLDLEEDGRSLGSKVLEGSEAKVKASLAAALDLSIVPPLKKAFPAPEVAVTPPPPPPDVAPPPKEVLITAPAPAPALALAPVAATVSVGRPSGVRTTGLVIGVVGLVGLAAAGVLGGMTLDAVSRRDLACPQGAQCSDPLAFTLHDRAAFTQDLGMVMAITSGAFLVTGTLLFIAGAPAQPRIALVPGLHGPALFVSTTF